MSRDGFQAGTSADPLRTAIAKPNQSKTTSVTESRSRSTCCRVAGISNARDAPESGISRGGISTREVLKWKLFRLEKDRTNNLDYFRRCFAAGIFNVAD